MNSPNSLLDFLNVDDPSFSLDHSTLSWTYNQCQSPVKLEDEGWNLLLGGAVAPASLVIPDDDLDSQNEVYIPGGLSQISMSSSSRSTTPDDMYSMALQSPPLQMSQPTEPTTVAVNPSSFHMQPTIRAPTSPLVHQSFTPAMNKKKGLTNGAAPITANGHNGNSNITPHPYSISPHNTAALFTRASSVSSNTSSTVVPAKKSRAPPSGPISTRDFIPPDVSGLNKREARLVKNRAAAFLSRQRKREEFEGLEARVEVLENDNARLYRENEGYKNGTTRPSNSSSPSASSTGALAAEIAGLKRQLGSRDVELSNLHTRIRSLVGAQDQLAIERGLAAERDREISELRSRLAAFESATTIVAPTAATQEVMDSDDSDSEDAQSTVMSRKEMKNAGGVAVMALLFSLSTLLANGDKSVTSPPKPVASERVTSRPSMHHRSGSSTLNGYSYDPSSSFSFESLLSSGPSSGAFGFDEESLMATPKCDPFSHLLSTPASEENALKKAISAVKSTGPNEFEFDFTMPASSSSSLVSYYGTPTTRVPVEKQRKIKVCVRSAVPLDLGPAAFGSMDDLDAPQPSGLGKRKRVTVDIKPRRNVAFADAPRSTRRKLSDEERWDVDLTQDMTDDDKDAEGDDVEYADADVLMS
ncbi:hypothetical protein FRB96_008482 [Tulasnella sp. 330]|nr:hypothetical protein FRB96_008482 [Tulasnella sp. 330]KAG8884005.1 hypothetical protein FRB97_005449 [Tulasnella sp. 331]KAG8889329.1 hypothetical protein FRB98_004946 [Tulasnella sp. 332]